MQTNKMLEILNYTYIILIFNKDVSIYANFNSLYEELNYLVKRIDV